MDTEANICRRESLQSGRLKGYLMPTLIWYVSHELQILLLASLFIRIGRALKLRCDLCYDPILRCPKCGVVGPTYACQV